MALAFPPISNPPIVEQTKLMAEVWLRWFRYLTDRVQTTPNVSAKVTKTAQSAAIATSAFALGTVGAGLYRVSYIARITTAATTSSSLTVTIGNTEGGISLTQSGAAMTGNTTSTVQSNTFTLRSDASVSITYATAYASVGGTAMKYRLDLFVETIS